MIIYLMRRAAALILGLDAAEIDARLDTADSWLGEHSAEFVAVKTRLGSLENLLAEDVDKLDRRLLALNAKIMQLMTWAQEMQDWAEQVSKLLPAQSPSCPTGGVCGNGKA